MHRGLLFRNTHHKYNNERGSIVYWLFFTLIIITAYSFHFDTSNGYITKKLLHDSIENSLQAAGTLWAKDHGYSPIDRDVALANFNLYLQKNLQLDSNNMPLPNSPVTSQVKVVEFNVINTVPSVDPIKGDLVEYYSIEAVVTTTAKPYLNSLYNGTAYTITDFARVSLKPNQ